VIKQCVGEKCWEFKLEIVLKSYFGRFPQGAYVFNNVNSQSEVLFPDGAEEIRFYEGKVVKQITFDFDRVVQNIKFRKDFLTAGIEIETYVKSLKQLHSSEDMIILFKTSSIKNKDTFFTDSNGLKMIKRVRKTPQNIAMSYYPVTSAIYIQDNDLRMTYNYFPPI